MTKINLIWYNFFSWWVFVWFIFHKLGMIPYNPYIIYIIIYIFLFYKLGLFLINKEYNIKPNFNILIIIGIIIIIIDIIPIFFLKRKIDIDSIIFSLVLALVYILFMTIRKINIKKIYDNVSYKNIMLNYNSEDILKAIFF